MIVNMLWSNDSSMFLEVEWLDWFSSCNMGTVGLQGSLNLCLGKLYADCPKIYKRIRRMLDKNR